MKSQQCYSAWGRRSKNIFLLSIDGQYLLLVKITLKLSSVTNILNLKNIYSQLARYKLLITHRLKHQDLPIQTRYSFYAASGGYWNLHTTVVQAFVHLTYGLQLTKDFFTSIARLQNFYNLRLTSAASCDRLICINALVSLCQLMQFNLVLCQGGGTKNVSLEL